MKNPAAQLRTCKQGHRYYKSTKCPTCPACENDRRPKIGFASLLAAPARRALENKGINTLRQLSNFSEKELLALHGLGPGSIPKLRERLLAEGLPFRK